MDDLQSKLSALQQKLFETRNKNVELNNQLKLAQKCLQQEVGEHFNLNILASHPANSTWRGRAQQILHLQQKVQELKERLESHEQQNFHHANMLSTLDVGDTVLTATGGSILSLDRPNVRRSELQHRVKVEALEKDIASLKSQLEESHSKILALKVRNKTLNDEISRHRMKANNLEDQNDFHSINMAAMNEKLNQQKMQYEKRIGELTRDLNAFGKEKEDVNLKEENLLNKVNNLEAIIADKDETIFELNTVVKKLETDLKATCGEFLFSCRDFRKVST